MVLTRFKELNVEYRIESSTNVFKEPQASFVETSEPKEDVVGQFIYRAHLLHLMAPLLSAPLNYTYGVDPQSGSERN
jgi:hypothetical protein